MGTANHDLVSRGSVFSGRIDALEYVRSVDNAEHRLDALIDQSVLGHLLWREQHTRLLQLQRIVTQA